MLAFRTAFAGETPQIDPAELTNEVRLQKDNGGYWHRNGPMNRMIARRKAHEAYPIPRNSIGCRIGKHGDWSGGGRLPRTLQALYDVSIPATLPDKVLVEYTVVYAKLLMEYIHGCVVASSFFLFAFRRPLGFPCFTNSSGNA